MVQFIFSARTDLQSVALSATVIEPSTMQVTHLSAELWEMIAKFCLQTNELRSVYNVTEELLALQLVCTTSSKFAIKLWPSIAQLCARKVRRLAENACDASAVLLHFKTLVMPHFMLKNFNPALAGSNPGSICTITDRKSDTNQSQQSKKAASSHH